MRQPKLLALVSMLVLLGSTTLTMAADEGRGGKIKQALAQLDLTAQQKQQIKQIITQAKSQASTAPSTGGKTHVHGARKEILQKILAVLTPDQKTKLKEILKPEKSKA